MWLLQASLAHAAAGLPWTALAHAEASDDPPPDLEIVVEEELTVAAARGRLDQAIVDEGYFRGVDLGDRTFYYPRQFWKPRVTVYDEGFVKVKGRVVSPLPCFPVVGVWAHPHVVDQMEAEVVYALNPELSAYRRALVNRGLVLRREELLVELDRIALLPIPQAQGEAVSLWLATADTEQGETVRRWIEAWYEDHLPPLTPDEVALVNEARAFPRPWQPQALGEYWFDPRPEPDFEFLYEEEEETWSPEVQGEGLDADIQTLPPPQKQKKSPLERLNGGG